MKIVVGTVDGMVHESRDFAREEIEAELDDTNYKTVEEALEDIESYLKYDTGNDTQTVSMTMPNGITRKFNVAHIIWWEFEGLD